MRKNKGPLFSRDLMLDEAIRRLTPESQLKARVSFVVSAVVDVTECPCALEARIAALRGLSKMLELRVSALEHELRRKEKTK